MSALSLPGSGSPVGHTPGPWISENGGGRGSWIKGSTGEWAALSCGDTDDRAEANALLIAAAPDLMAALQNARTALAEMAADYVLSHQDDIRIEAAIHAADAALASAGLSSTDRDTHG